MLFPEMLYLLLYLVLKYLFRLMVILCHDIHVGLLCMRKQIHRFDQQQYNTIHTYIHTYIHTNLYSTKNCVNESEALQ